MLSTGIYIVHLHPNVISEQVFFFAREKFEIKVNKGRTECDNNIKVKMIF